MNARQARCLVVSTIASLALLPVHGCSARHAIVASTATNIGVDISQNPATSSPQAKLGYQRTELAIVPTNRSADVDAAETGAGAKDHGDVIMELRYGGIFDVGKSSGIYQRLAVGTTAVRQPGASLMFAKDDEGTVTSAAATALENLETVPTIPPDVEKTLAELSKRRSCNQTRVDAAIKAAGVKNYDDVADLKFTLEQLKQIMDKTKDACPSTNS